MYPLHLSLQPGAWRLFAARKSDPAFEKFSQAVLRRDNFTCQYCGFQAQDYQEIINKDGNYKNNKKSNLVTACCFCAQCFFLDAVGVGDYGGGTLVYLPELEQTNLNSFCHVLFCAITNDTGYKSNAQTVYRSFKFRSQIVEEQFGDGTSNPAVLAQLLVESEASEEQRSKVLDQLRLLPSRGRFRTQIEHWAATALQELASDDVGL